MKKYQHHEKVKQLVLEGHTFSIKEYGHDAYVSVYSTEHKKMMHTVVTRLVLASWLIELWGDLTFERALQKGGTL